MKFDPEFQREVTESREYAAVAHFYGERCAKRSKVPLINHINQGIAIIGALGGVLPGGEPFRPLLAARAYCLHPLFQNDAQLLREGMRYLGSRKNVAAEPVAIAMEYRWRANNWLSDKVGEGGVPVGEPDAGPVREVRAALIADKVQNFKDFIDHHAKTHERSVELNRYFCIWISHLGINDLSSMVRLFAVTNEVPA